MKRLRSSDDLNSIGEKSVCKDSDSNRSSSHRSYYYKSENGRKGLSSSYSSRYDRSVDEERESLRSVRKRSDYNSESFDRRKGFDRYWECGERGGSVVSSPRSGYNVDRIHRSESFCGSRREFPKGFRSERDRSRREGSVSSWRRFGGSKDYDDGGRSGSDSVRGTRGGLEDRGSARSPRGLRETKSPALSKDSGSEQSKSIEVKKNEELQVESAGGSEMEEGELEPEPEHVSELEPQNETKAHPGLDPDCEEVRTREVVEEMVLEDQGKSSSEEEKMPDKESGSEWKQEVGRWGTEHSKETDCEGKMEAEPQDPAEDVVQEINELPDCHNNLTDGMGSSRDEFRSCDEGGGKDECFRDGSICKEDVKEDITVDESLPSVKESKEDKGIHLEVDAENANLQEPGMEVAQENGVPGVTLNLIMDEFTQNSKEKGKNVASDIHDITGGEVYVERGSSNLVICSDSDMEGPRSRGFELFSGPMVKKQERMDQSDINKLKDEKLMLEPLDLSLSLPNVLLPISSTNLIPAPGSPSRARSVQSLSNTFRTNSDGFTASVSFSGSQPFAHNPSCSLTQNSLDNYEQSVGSRPIFQGVDQVSHGTWQGQSSNDPKHKDVPLYQKNLLNESGSLHQLHMSQVILNGEVVQDQHLRVSERSTKTPIGLDRQLSFHKQLSGAQTRHFSDVRSPSQSVGSRETVSEYSKDKRQLMRDKNGSILYRTSSQNENEQVGIGGADFVQTMIAMIISEPFYVVARRFQEMAERSIACLKGGIFEIMVNAAKHGQPCPFQKALQKGSDVTLEMLLKCHRAQLEIMVAMRTGIHDFLQQSNSISASDLAEIYLNSRCRNLGCRQLLPVEECDCKVCSQKNGFCSSCMCLMCSKFDNASNTCGWVGCDVCLHWCHTDCGLRENLIRNGRSSTGAHGIAEMQFHCVACGHPSEMYGFVKAVFQNFAKMWQAETLSKELEYVRRIFRASKDVKGKQLRDIADQMLEKLAKGSDLPEVYNPILHFLTENCSSELGNSPILSGKEQGEGSNRITGWGQETIGPDSVYSEKASQLERVARIPQFDCDRNDKQSVNPELQNGSLKEPVFDELESIVRIKQAEAKMFQARSDDARREAEGLKCISIAKNEKIEEEFTSRIKKLRLVEAEEMRRQKLEQLQTLERAHREYSNMKMRMEADIKDLLLKMEATKQNLSL